MKMYHILVEYEFGAAKTLLKYVGSSENIDEIISFKKLTESEDLIPLFSQLFGEEITQKFSSVAQNGGSFQWETPGNLFKGEGNSFGEASKFHGNRILVSIIQDSFSNQTNSDNSEKPTENKEELRRLNVDLEQQVKTHKRKFQSADQELSDFTYSVSHDLRAPLRRLDGFSEALLQDKYLEKLDERGIHYLQRIKKAANDMGVLIDDLLKLSRITRRTIEVEEIDVSSLSQEVFSELLTEEEENKINFSVGKGLTLRADYGLLKIVMQNLLQNAIKYSSLEENPEIEVGGEIREDVNIIYVRDNGVGFDMKHAKNLFRAFQRLHSDFEFEGNGIGLATVKRIINIHGGNIWAESKPEEGSTFYFYT